MCLFGWWDGIYLVGFCFVSFLQAESRSAGILHMRGFGWGSVRIYFVLCSLKAKGKKEGVLESDTVFPRRDLRKT